MSSVTNNAAPPSHVCSSLLCSLHPVVSARPSPALPPRTTLLIPLLSLPDQNPYILVASVFERAQRSEPLPSVQVSRSIATCDGAWPRLIGRLNPARGRTWTQMMTSRSWLNPLRSTDFGAQRAGGQRTRGWVPVLAVLGLGLLCQRLMLKKKSRISLGMTMLKRLQCRVGMV